MPCHFVSFFPFENGVPKCHKKSEKFTCKSFENLLFHQFPILVISRKCVIKIEKQAYINADKSGHAFAE